MKKNIWKIIVLILIDQLIKVIISNTIAKTGESISIIPNLLQLTYVENFGGAFGIFMTRILLIGVNLLIIFVIIKLLTSKKYDFDNKSKLGFSLILAGGIGNLIDRVFRGYVIDYIDITEILNYPVFNFADMCIVVGVILIMAMIIFNTIRTQEKVWKCVYIQTHYYKRPPNLVGVIPLRWATMQNT